MKKVRKMCYFFILSLILFCQVGTAFTKDTDKLIYGSELYDEIRQLKYWAIVYISVNDYKYKSGDAPYLNLAYPDPEKKSSYLTARPIINHFNNEFIRLIKGDLPIIDTDKGREERLKLFLEKKKELDVAEYRAYEEARRNSLFGKNPGAIYCLIKISRRDFPILYEIETGIVANNYLINIGGLREKDIGFSTPEHIEGELKKAITEHLKELSKEMDKIKKYSKR